MSKLIQIKDLNVSFDLPSGAIHVLKDISFDVPYGKSVALVGESGSGKSVTSQAIMQILPSIAHIDSGEILFSPSADKAAVDIAKIPRNSAQMRAIRGGQISMIFQEPMVSLSPLHTIGNQISEALLLHRGVSQKQGMQLTEAMLEKVGFPNPSQALNTYPFELSGGLRQRAMIAMALVCHPSLLIADEPSTALDVTIQAQILKLIADLQAELNMAVLLITHDLGVVANIADEVVVMYQGEIMESGDIQTIYRNPSHPYLKALFNAVPHFDMKPGERLVPIRDIEQHDSVLFSHSDSDKRSTEIINPLHLEVKNLSKSYTIRKQGFWKTKNEDKVKAVDDISFNVMRGECFGLVGESGCGKTTLSKMLMRALSADSGEIIYHDNSHDANKAINVFDLDNQQLFDFRKKMQFIFQDPFSSLNPRMSVFDILREPLVIHSMGDLDYQKKWCQDLMNIVGLDPNTLNRYPHSFSGGQRQRVGIARALALNPEFLICDEPVSALDVSIQAQILNLLRDLQKKLGLTSIFISHNLAVIDYVADRVAVMCYGRIVEIAPKEDLFKNPTHPYTQTLLEAVPYPNLDKPLNYDLIMASRSDPSQWPHPFTESKDQQNQAHLQEISPQHFVRVTEQL